MATTSDMAPTRRKSATGARAAKAAAATEASVRGAVADTRERQLEAQVAQLQDDLKAITDTLAKLTGDKVGEARAIAKTEMRHLQAKGEQLLSEAQDQAGEVEKQLKDSIREKPLTAVAAAAGIGFVFALLTRH
ncbi:Membrane-anchored ribosome-binding protein, inhibits growth in stationary phase, ElaB/YqjD/DUF883 family [Devosia lucknowensis]|uniref:Membrane-anchored ribosome-binding protein, inhibits growth in stationary phase, ElaB/YqjD/DUF883 family n=1 Tax=Devosia lucknowensis TaxID=1096929 RepID=A0A1Y6FBM1_9HYPH|nr:DUF883 family protein [Devosia lucknowensis]SMQ72205.1 Membrane-anchored ribosome-binding protein, inhibits growth in stationary phase, ElaB/YqjD/DUF883 family [Devosia lucknowensis]